MKFLCEQCKAKYQIADDKVVGKTVRMKCRKCGHLIEVRAEVTETSVASGPPQAPAAGASALGAGGPPRPLAKPAAPPRASALAASLTSARPQAPAKTGALAGAFRATVQHEEEISAPFDMAEISASDDWYVAINGVPVGPVRVAELRRKAALGSVTEDSLVWQEGLDEWRPLRSFPELVAIVRSAVTPGRPSLTPAPPEVRGSVPPPGRASTRPAQNVPPQRQTGSRIGAPVAAAAARNNVVPISARLATAERLPEPESIEPPTPLLAPAPASAFEGPASTQVSVAAAPPRRDIPWMPIMMVGMGLAFSVTLAIALKSEIASSLFPGKPEPSASASSAASAAPVVSAAPTVTAEATPVASVTAAPTKATPAGGGAIARATPSATATGRSLNLSGIGGNNVALGDDPSNDGPKAPGQCLSEGQIVRVVQLHQTAVKRSCWERSQSTKPSVNINVTLTVGGDGSVQSASASGDEPTVAKCIENDVRNWRFPAMGCSQKTAIPFKFLQQ